MSTIQILEDYLAEQLLSPQGYAQHCSGKVSKSELASFITEIAAISQSYISHTVGSKLPSPIKGQLAAQAYALYYTVINAAKIMHLTPLLSLPPKEISVLDIGCGPGTAGLALLSTLPHAIKLDCIEHSTPMRSVAEHLLSGYKTKGAGSLTQLKILPKLPHELTGTFDIVLAANVLAELEETEGRRTMNALAERVAPHGYLIVLEPGQQLHTRRLMHLRDAVLETSPDLVPVFPCLRRDACPMLKASATDWCHGSIEWRQPRLNAQLDEFLSFNKHRIKYASFIFQRGGSIPDGVRVITPPDKTRAGIEATICGEGLYGVARIRKGTRSENNRALEKASVWDRLIMSEPCSGDIPEHVTITRARS